MAKAGAGAMPHFGRLRDGYLFEGGDPPQQGCKPLRCRSQFAPRHEIRMPAMSCPIAIRAAILAATLVACASSAVSQSPAASWSVGRFVVQNSSTRATPLGNDSILTEAVVFVPDDDIVVYDSPAFRPAKIIQGVAPALSPDGGIIAYCGFIPGLLRSQIMIMKSDGTGRKQLTSMNGSPCSPDWSPDGKKLAFDAETDHGKVVMILDFEQKTVSPVLRGASPRWSPDGSRLLFLRAPETHGAVASIWISDADGKHPRMVLDTFAPVPSASWDHDGKAIVYTGDDRHRSAIYRVALDGANPEKLVKDSNYDLYCPSLSPDGRLLVVVRTDSTLPVENRNSLVVIDLATQKQRWLTNAVRGDVYWTRSNGVPSGTGPSTK